MRILLTLTLLFASQLATAEALLCSHHADTMETTSSQEQGMRIFADNASGSFDGVFELSGSVTAFFQDRVLRAGKIIFDKDTGDIDALDNLEFIDPNLYVKGEQGNVNANTNSAHIESTTYTLPSRKAYGRAAVIDKAESISVLQDISYSTCDPDDQDWVLLASKLTLDHDSGFGSGRNITLKFKGVPFLFTPWASFPIDDKRKSGVLLPKLGRSKKHGTDITLPYYFNLAPNYDLTFSPRYMSRFGWLLGNEFRYLTKTSDGQIDADYLVGAHDRIDDDSISSDDDRYRYKVKHHSKITSALQVDIDFHQTSDQRYVNEFEVDLGEQSKTYLAKNAQLSYDEDNWFGLLESQKFQVIDSDYDRPYDRLPHFNLRYRSSPAPIEWSIETDHTEFQHATEVDGARSVLLTELGYRKQTSGLLFNPKLQWMQRYYRLQDQADNSSASSQVIFFTHAKAGFEKQLTHWQHITHRLTPHLYYAYIPYENQSDIPIFDTELRELSFYHMQQPNAYLGYDRLAETNEIRLQLDSEWLDQRNGRSPARLRVAQKFQLADRQSSNMTGVDTTNHSSNIIQDATIRIDKH